MSFAQRLLELSEPKSISGTTSSTAGTPTAVTVSGNVFEVVIYNRSVDYNLYVSFDFGDTWVTIPPDCAHARILGSFADPVLLVKSDGVSQTFEIHYRLRL